MTFQFGGTFGSSTILGVSCDGNDAFFVPEDLCIYSLHCTFERQEKLDLSEREKPKGISK